ncbi:rRNA-processing protein [Wickerhamomyces ciferrii]|uniref:U three protein 23 n=1 Tax=Wickerhamomyces ciferrii (strain ATCC 14091 / BCRC 22168 / CBS 111 / JCM 3599 / NBRC 0793 / NRRL Y-1031 F-60-10) TaxID=1206466 RepID=K0KI09_WICCF|nr:rRNA-processing protein [Wickerhamomyces ciferrii]CCH42656.1 rRNA-processing protein [Wickerhamomyces ciferrii]
MRQKRAKAYRKQMLVYNHTFKFREPYQIIVDEQLVLTAEKQSFDLAKGLTRTVQAEVKPKNNQPAIELARTFERRRCNHDPKDPLPPHECIKSIVIINNQNKHRYIVASENEQLRWSLRKIPGIPLIYMNRSVMVMEPLSKASAQVSNNMESAKLTKGLNSVGGDENKNELNDSNKLLKKKRGPQEPNPLSIKKKKPENNNNNNKNNNDNEGQKKKRRRKHKKHGEGEVEGETESKESEPKTNDSVSEKAEEKNDETSD